MEIYFFIGKGGVGKTTVSAAWGAGLSNNGKRTLVVSLDPAHNLGDAFDQAIPSRIKNLSPNLDAVEVDTDRMISNYLTEMSVKMKNTYRYLSTMNLDRYFDILKNSPGIEEYATLEAIKEHVSSNKYDAIIFDTPPTGMTIRVLAMPRVSIIWTDRLIDMRKKILSRRKMIENVQGKFEAIIEGETVVLTSEEKSDPLMQELVNYRGEMKRLRELFSSENCFISIVTMPEELALSETERISESLKGFKIKLRKILLNKFMKIEMPPEEIRGKIEEQDRVTVKMKERFKSIEIKEIPLLKESPRGFSQLLGVYNKYLK